MTSRRAGRAALALAALALVAGAGLAQTEAISAFRRPAVEQTLDLGQRVVVDGVGYRLSAVTADTALPLAVDQRTPGEPAVVPALAGAELVQVVLTVDIEDPARPADAVQCELALVAPDGRTWSRAGDVEYRVQGPAAITCAGDPDDPPRAGVPYEVGAVFQLPADAVDQVSVQLVLSGGAERHLLVLRPR